MSEIIFPVSGDAQEKLYKAFQDNRYLQQQIKALQQTQKKDEKTIIHLEAELVNIRVGMNDQKPSFHEGQTGELKRIHLLENELANAKEKIQDLELVINNYMEAENNQEKNTSDQANRRPSFYEGEKRRLERHIESLEQGFEICKSELEEQIKGLKKEIDRLEGVILGMGSSRTAPYPTPAFYGSSRSRS